MLMGGSSRHLDDTRTLIVIDVDRLKEEYVKGQRDQMLDEHWRKQIRIGVGVAISGIGLVAAVFNAPAITYATLFLNCIVHVLL